MAQSYPQIPQSKDTVGFEAQLCLRIPQLLNVARFLAQHNLQILWFFACLIFLLPQQVVIQSCKVVFAIFDWYLRTSKCRLDGNWRNHFWPKKSKCNSSMLHFCKEGAQLSHLHHRWIHHELRQHDNSSNQKNEEHPTTFVAQPFKSFFQSKCILIL